MDLKSVYLAHRDQQQAAEERAAGDRALLSMGVNLTPEERDPLSEGAAARMESAQQKQVQGAVEEQRKGERTAGEDPLATARREGVQLTAPQPDAKGLQPRAPKGQPIVEDEGSQLRKAWDTVLHALTGVGADEFDEAVRSGKIGDKLLQLIDPAGNIAADLVKRTALEHGVPADIAEKLSMGAAMAISVVADPMNAVGAGAKAAKGGAALSRARAASALSEAAAKGEGITYDLEKGALKVRSGQSVVSMRKGGTVFDHPPTTQELHTWLMSLDADPKAVSLWEDQGKWYADVSQVTTPDEARKLGKAERQRAIYHGADEGEGVVEALKYEPGEEGPPIRLEHYSNRPIEGGVIDPGYFGSGQAGRERARLTEPGFLPRSYYYEEGATPEARFAKDPNKYTVEVGENRIYDINADPEGLYAGAAGDVTKAEAAIRERGYAGYRNTSEFAQPQRAVVLFEKREVLPQPKPSMGTKVYHGTNVDFEKVDLAKGAGEGLWVAESPETAGIFARRGAAPQVRPYVLAPDVKLGTREDWFAAIEQVGLDPVKAREHLLAQGLDGIKYEGYGGEPGARYQMFNMSKLIEPFTGQTAAQLALAGGAAAAASQMQNEEAGPYAGTVVGAAMFAVGSQGNLPLLKQMRAVSALKPRSAIWNAVAARGAAHMFMGARGQKAFGEALVQEFGHEIAEHVPGLFEHAKAINEKNLSALRGKLSRFESVIDTWNMAEGQPFWYAPRQTLDEMFGPDAELMAGLIAATSPGATAAKANLDAALEAYKIIKLEPETAWRGLLGDNAKLREGYGATSKVPNIIRAAKDEPLHGNKVSDFHVALLGETNVGPIDRHMVPVIFNRLSDEEAVALATGLDDAKYAVATEWLREFGERQGSPSLVYTQQRLWMGKRLGEFLMEGNEPVYEMLAKRVAEQPEVLDLVPKSRLMDESGRVNVAVMYALGRTAVGAVVGSQFGDTLEERLQNGLVAAGGAAVAPPVLKKLATLVKEHAPSLRSAVRHGKSKNMYPPQVWQRLDGLFARYEQAVDEARRGVRPHEMALGEAEQMIRDGRMSLDDVRAAFPGMTLNDSEAMALVRLVSDEGVQLQDFAKTLQPVAEQGQLSVAQAEDFLERMYVLRELLPKQAGVVAESGRTLSAMNEPTSGWNHYLRQWHDLFSDPASGLTPERLVSLVARMESPLALAKVAKATTEVGWSDIAIEMLYGALLSNPVTPTVNAISNTLTALYAPVERLGAVIAGDSHHWLEPAAMVYGMTKAVPKAFKYAKHAFMSGEQILQGGRKIEAAHAPAMTPENLSRLMHSSLLGRLADVVVGVTSGAAAGASVGYASDNTEAGAAVGALVGAVAGGGRMARLGGRLLLTTDELFRTMLYEGELHAQAVRRGYAETDKARRAAVIRETLQNPTFVIRKAAQNLADEFTFNAESGPVVQGLIDGFERLPGPYKVLARAVLPFMRVPSNLFKFTARRTPGLQQLHASWLADLNTPGPRQDTALAQLALGSGFLAATTMWAVEGGLVGSGPADPNLRREWLADGNQEYSAVFGDTTISINRADPFGMVLSLVADWAAVAAHLDEASNDQIAAAMLMAVSKDMMSKTYLEGASNVMEAITARDPNKAYRFLQSMTSTPVPGIVKQSRRLSDEHLREVRTLIDAAKNRVPGLSKELPISRNIFAQPLPTHEPLGWGLDWINPFTIKKIKRDAAANALLDNRISPSMPGWYIYGNQAKQWTLNPQRESVGVELTPHQRDELVRLIGEPLHKEWSEFVKSKDYEDGTPGPDGSRALVFRRMYRKFHEAGVAQLLENHRDLQTKLEDVLTRRAKALSGE